MRNIETEPNRQKINSKASCMPICVHVPRLILGTRGTCYYYSCLIEIGLFPCTSYNFASLTRSLSFSLFPSVVRLSSWSSLSKNVYGVYKRIHYMIILVHCMHAPSIQSLSPSLFGSCAYLSRFALEIDEKLNM